jgi:hypothetical protein
MAKLQFFLFLLAIVWWLYQDVEGPAPPTPHRIEQLLDILDLVHYVVKTDGAVKKDGDKCWLKDHNNNVIPFSPDSFVKTNGISSRSDVRRVNKQISNDLRRCTDEVLRENRYSGSPEMHRLRAECLERIGYSENDLAYTRVKFNL